MKTTRKWFYGMASAAVIALVVALNTGALAGKASNVNAMEQATETSGAQNNAVVLADKAKAVESLAKYQVEVPYDLEVEKADQKNADGGSSPWKLDPLFVTQVFVSLEVSPDGIVGDYPVKYEELKLVESNSEEAAVEVGENAASIGKVYLKRLVKQDDTGVWTVVGYDKINK